jgi:type IV pilus assembly protein PilB
MVAQDPGTQEIVSFLSQVSLFKNVRDDYKLSIAQRMEHLTFPKDHVIFNEGDIGDALYIIRKGSVGVFIVEPMVGLSFELARLRIGQVFGEMAVITDERRSATCKAMEETVCYMLPRETFHRIIERIPDVAIGIAKELAERVILLNKERGMAMVDINKLNFDPDVFKLVPQKLIDQHRMMPLNIKEGVLTVACVDIQNLAGLDEIRRIIRGVSINPVAVPETEYRAFFEKHINKLKAAGGGGAVKANVQRVASIRWVGDDPKDSGDVAKGEEVKALVDRIVAEGIEREASDIHIEPERDALQVRYRISGALARRTGGAPIPKALHRAVASRVKVLAELDISEKRRPQDGRISLEANGRHLDLRVSSLPTPAGEKVVMRILDSANAVQPLQRLILAEKVCRVVQQLVGRPYGVVYVCGPTGSGKTTTLYSALGSRKREDTNITTVEDPVEYNIPGITQVNVNHDIGLTFASVLRAILRQDPNVILVGETRDRETGKIVLEAGLTGHLVLTSLHTNDAIGTIQRLREMGLENFAIAASLVGVISQRLVRRLCPACSVEANLSPHVLEQLAGVEVVGRDFRGKVRIAKGCDVCGGSGYRGRVGVYEILVADDDLRQAITSNASTLDLRKTALRGAFVPMTRYSNYLLTSGVTTAEELLSVHAGASN